MADGVTVTVALTLKPETADAFCGMFNEMLRTTAQAEGFRAMRVVRQSAPADRLLAIESWDSEDAYKTYMGARAASGDMEAVGNYLLAPPEIQFWPVTLANI